MDLVYCRDDFRRGVLEYTRYILNTNQQQLYTAAAALRTYDMYVQQYNPQYRSNSKIPSTVHV